MRIARLPAFVFGGALLFALACGKQDDTRTGPTQAPQEESPAPQQPEPAPLPAQPAEPPTVPGEESPPAAEAVPPAPVRIYMAESDLDLLYKRDPRSDEYLPASVLLPGMETPIVARGLRFRGAATRAYEKKSLNVRFEERQPFLFGGPKRRGGSHFNLNALWTDPTALREPLSYEMFREVGIPTPATKFVDVYLNDVFEGLHLAVERVDHDLLSRSSLTHDEKEVLLVRDQTKGYEALPERSAFGLDLARAFPGDDAAQLAGLQKLFEYRGDLEDQDWRPLLDLVRWVGATPAGPAFEAGIRERFDVENLLNFLAVHMLVQSLDSLDGDYWMHRDIHEQRWRLIPWDKNLTFGTNYEVGLGGGATDYFRYDFAVIGTLGNALFDKLIATPALRRDLHARVRALMAGPFTREWIESRARANLDGMRASLERPPGPDAYKRNPQQHHGERGRLEEHLEALFDFVELRYRYLDRQLEGGAKVGTAYQAEQTLRNAAAGEKVFVTDPNGWVIANIVLSEPVSEAVLSARVSPTGASAGVAREWRLEARGAAVKGALTLYYRNHATENWTDRLEPVGLERSLEVVQTRANETARLTTQVNPYSNKATTYVELSAGAPVSFRLLYATGTDRVVGPVQ